MSRGDFVRLKELRKAKGLSQLKLAIDLNTNQNTSEPSLYQKKKYAPWISLSFLSIIDPSLPAHQADDGERLQRSQHKISGLFTKIQSITKCTKRIQICGVTKEDQEEGRRAKLGGRHRILYLPSGMSFFLVLIDSLLMVTWWSVIIPNVPTSGFISLV